MMSSPGGGSAASEWVELLRGCAALMVMFAHFLLPLSGLHSFGYTGVDLFFVISGFVFAPMLSGRRVALLPYLIRRSFRIYPLYVVAVAVYAGLKLMRAEPVRYALDHLLMAHTLRSMEIALSLNAAFWTLPPEVEFYLALPLLAVVARRPFGLWGLLCLAVAMRCAVGLQRPLSEANVGWLLMGVHLPGLLIEFLLGTVAWRISRVATRAMRWALLLIGVIVLGLAMLLFVQTLRPASMGPGLQFGWLTHDIGLLSALSYAALLAALASAAPKLPPGGRQLAAFLGGCSYAVYLFHGAVLALLPAWMPSASTFWQLAACVVSTLGLAAAMHRGIEAPLRRLGRNWAARHERPGAQPGLPVGV